MHHAGRLIPSLMLCSLFLIFINSAHAESYTGVLRLDPVPSSVNYGDRITFSGYLTTTSGHVIPNATISIKDDVTFGRDTIIGRATTDSAGKFSIEWTAYSRSSGLWDFYAVYDGASNVSKSRSSTYNVQVSSNSASQNYSYATSITLDRIPQSVYAGKSVTFTGKLTSNGAPLEGKLVQIKENDPLLFDQIIGSDRTDRNGNYEVKWRVSAGLVETDFDIHAVFGGDSSYDGARSYDQEMSVLKYGGSIMLNEIPRSVKIGEVVTFSGILNLDRHSPEGAVVYIKDEDPLNADDLIATAYVDEYGRFSADWRVTKVDADNVADIYAVFEGNNELYRLTTCDAGYLLPYGGLCPDTIDLRINGHATAPPPDYEDGEYMKLLYSLSFTNTPKVAISPSPDSYETVRGHIMPVKEGIDMWTSHLESKYGGNWDVEFKIIPRGDPFPLLEFKPDVIVNIVTSDDDVDCIDESLLGYAIISPNPTKPVQTTVCSASQGQLRSSASVAATAGHEFIHAVGLGHAFNKNNDLMCSREDGRPTCDSTYYKSKMPSDLNLDAVVHLYGADGFKNPNNRVTYEEKFYSGNSNSESNYRYVPTTTSDQCTRTDNRYDIAVDRNLDPSHYVWWGICSDMTVNYYFSTSNEYQGFMIFVLPPKTDVDDFINYRTGSYYTCEEYEKPWLSKGGSCTIAPGSSIVVYNYGDNTISLSGYIRS